MKKLILDTSTDFLFVFFLENDSIIFQKVQEGRNNHSEHLMEIIQEGLQENNMLMNEFDEIFVGIGPGSYTGLRLSLTVAKMIAWTLQKELFAFSSLDLVASKCFHQDGVIMPRIKAKKGYSYVSVKQVEKGYVTTLEQDVFLEDEQVSKMQERYQSIICQVSNEVDPLRLLKNELFEKVEDVYGVVPKYLRGEL